MQKQQAVSLANHPLSDEEIIDRVQAGDVALYEVLMRRHNQRIYRCARAILRSESEVDDVLQEAYFAAFEHLDRFDRRAKFSTWLTRIAINKALDRLRRASRLVGLDGWPEEDLPHEVPPDRSRTNPEAQSSARQLAGLLESAIDRLPVAFRSVYMLREIEGLSTEEVAKSLGIEASTVKTRLHRARLRLRRELERRTGSCAEETFTFGNERCDHLVREVMQAVCIRYG